LIALLSPPASRVHAWVESVVQHRKLVGLLCGTTMMKPYWSAALFRPGA
jgi:hypothetical protein